MKNCEFIVICIKKQSIHTFGFSVYGQRLCLCASIGCRCGLGQRFCLRLLSVLLPNFESKIGYMNIIYINYKNKYMYNIKNEFFC